MTTRIMRIPERGGAATAVSMNASFNGDAYSLEYLDGYSICAKVTETSASLAGTLKLQASNNAFTNNTSNQTNSSATWVDIASTDVTLTSGNTNVLWNVSDANYEAVRIVWTRSSGQGTIEVYLLAKGI